MPSQLRTVPDTNVVISAEYGNTNSPNKEYFQRWHKQEFDLLYSIDTLSEYVLKLTDFGILDEDIKAIVKRILKYGIRVRIVYFHYPEYPPDPDDIAFILCADNGNATHLISYDRDLLDITYHYPFKICRTLDFLGELRK